MSTLRLVLDAGNTRIKWALARGGNFVANGAVPTNASGRLGREWMGLDLHGVRAVACSVAGDAVRAAVADAVTAAGGEGVAWLASGERCAGVRNGYARPSQLGVDRWAALIGARARSHEPTIIVNAGTAITIDALTASGEFIGGMILPGVELMLEALASRTAGLTAQRGAFSEFPRNTADAMTTGALDAATGAATRAQLRLQGREGKPVRMLVSGGAAEALLPCLPAGAEHVTHLVLAGLLVADDAGGCE